MTAALKEVFQHAYTQGEFEMAGIVVILEAGDEQDFWVGFDEGEKPWEPLATILNGAPQFFMSELLKLRLDRGVRSRLQTFYGFTL